MGDKPAQTVVWQAAIGMLAVDQSQKSIYIEVSSFRIFLTLSMAMQVIEREGGEEVRIR